MYRDKVAVTLILLFIQQILTTETKSVSKNKSSKNFSFPKTLTTEIDLLDKYSFPQNEYPTLNKYPIYETTSLQQEKIETQKYPSQAKCLQNPRKRKKIKSLCYQCNNVKKYPLDTKSDLKVDVICYNINSSFPEVEYPLTASEIWKPSYWRTTQEDLPKTIANNQIQSCRNRKRNKLPWINCSKQLKKKKSSDKKIKNDCFNGTSSLSCLNASMTSKPCSNLTCKLATHESYVTDKGVSSDNISYNEFICSKEDLSKTANNETEFDDFEFIFIPNDSLTLSTPPPFSTTESCDFNTESVPLE